MQIKCRSNPVLNRHAFVPSDKCVRLQHQTRSSPAQNAFSSYFASDWSRSLSMPPMISISPRDRFSLSLDYNQSYACSLVFGHHKTLRRSALAGVMDLKIHSKQSSPPLQFRLTPCRDIYMIEAVASEPTVPLARIKLFTFYLRLFPHCAQCGNSPIIPKIMPAY